MDERKQLVRAGREFSGIKKTYSEKSLRKNRMQKERKHNRHLPKSDGSYEGKSNEAHTYLGKRTILSFFSAVLVCLSVCCVSALPSSIVISLMSLPPSIPVFLLNALLNQH
mmetsp:Transcript_29749/g.58391  ORF Transcript_29749/g.58391 Transcript_29749/m.58391 type:complete len:111 (+) Transcript_29749:554-886(+)